MTYIKTIYDDHFEDDEPSPMILFSNVLMRLLFTFNNNNNIYNNKARLGVSLKLHENCLNELIKQKIIIYDYD